MNKKNSSDILSCQRTFPFHNFISNLLLLREFRKIFKKSFAMTLYSTLSITYGQQGHNTEYWIFIINSFHVTGLFIYPPENIRKS